MAVIQVSEILQFTQTDVSVKIMTRYCTRIMTIVATSKAPGVWIVL